MPWPWLSLLVLALPALAADGGRALQGRSERQPGKGLVTLAEARQACLPIVVPAGAPAPVRFAAEELREHLDRMTGARFAIVAQVPADRRAIVLGTGPQPSLAAGDIAGLGRDGYTIRMVDDLILIAGRDDATAKAEVLFTLKDKPFPPSTHKDIVNEAVGHIAFDFERGTLYGAYRFLEELGVRWFMPGPVGTVIPTREHLEVPRFSLTEDPAFTLREAGPSVWHWNRIAHPNLVKMVDRQEYVDVGLEARNHRLWLLRMRHSSAWLAFNHRPPNQCWEERFGQTHPEYFALLPSGQRDLKPVAGRTGHLCYTSAGMDRETQLDIAAFFDGQEATSRGMPVAHAARNRQNRGWSLGAAYGNSFSLLPHDSFRACECPTCLPLHRKDRPYPAQHSNLVWPFVARIAADVESRYPGKLITCLAYSSYAEPPDAPARLPGNVVVGLCHSAYAHPANLVDPARYAEFMELIRQWEARTDQPLLYWQHYLTRWARPLHRGVPMLLTRHYVHLVRDLAAHGVYMHMEMDGDSPMLEHLTRYVALKALYTPTVDAETLVADYAAAFYGAGGAELLPVLRDIETRCERLAAERAGITDIWDTHFPEPVLQAYRRHADAAARLTRGTDRAEAVRLFSVYFLGAMEGGRANYVSQIKQVAEAPESSVSIRQLQGNVVVDGRLDEEGWRRSGVVSFVNNVDGKPTRQKTELRLLRATESLYFGFTCYDPNAAALSDRPGEADYVELFLDPEHAHRSYYWLMVDLTGRLTQAYFVAPGEPPDSSWASHAKVAVQRQADRWTVELELPRQNLKDGLETPLGRPWGANFCRTLHQPPTPDDTFSGWSPLLRGRFHQPDLFGHIHFVK